MSGGGDADGGDGGGGERDALISWAMLAEPGDTLAHGLVAVLGAARALEWLGADPPAARAMLMRHASRDAIVAAEAAAERWRMRLDAARPERLLEATAQCGARVVHRGGSGWPAALDDLGAAAPFALWVRGAAWEDGLAERWSAALAVVGSRAASTYGEAAAAGIAAAAADAGTCVISGGAYGIDARAHRGALAAGGTTVAVMAGGVDRLYPIGNEDLLREVLESGAVVSESPPGFAPHRARFLTRNRLIACARATVVVEAAHRSGALNTARHALELGRAVGAVPGPVTSASSSGCHGLIREGATLVRSGEDALELCRSLGVPDGAAAVDPAVPGSRTSRGLVAPDFADSRQRAAYDALGRRGASLARVCSAAGLTADEARAALGALELAGLVVRGDTGWERRSR